MIGQRLGHYRLVAELGAGGMGVVYRAHDEHLDREVAIKVLPPDAFSEESARKRFRKEALALAKLSDAHIAHVHDFATDDGVDFLVMELVPGRSLAQTLTGGALPERDVLRLGVQLASALEEAHVHGIVHRDLKPGNLMLTPKGELKVLDFGLAKLLHEPTADGATLSATDAGAVAGTLPYMAPEQLRAQAVDARTDIWAAGVVLYETAAGRKPFSEQVLASLTDAILNRAPTPPTAVDPKISAGFERLVLKCLEKDPGRRFQSATELADDLERLLTPGTPTTAETATRRVIPKSWLAAAAAVVMVVACGVVALRHWRGRGPVPAGMPIASLAVLPLTNMTGDAGQEYFSDGMTEALITELSKIRSLKVTSRTSAMRFKKSDKALPEIAKQLGVEGIVEGSVTRSGGRVRVTAQLIQAASDQHLWADTFDRQEADVLALQSDVARAIASQVRAAVTPDEERRLGVTRKVNPEAYDLMLQGFQLLRSGGGPDALHRAIELFERAVAVDPSSAQAHAGLASALQMFAGYGFGPYWDVYPRIRKEVDSALALDPSNAWAEMARGDLLWAEKDSQGALAAYRRAAELAPGDAVILTNYAGALSRIEPGPEAERLFRKGIEIDPLAQLPRCNYKDFLYGKWRYDEAEAQAHKILDLDPDWFWAWDQLWRIHLRQGKLEEAEEESRRAWAVAFGETFRQPRGLSWEAYDRSLDNFLESEARTWVPGFLAADYARRGEKQKALGYLEKAAAGNSTFMWLLDWPEFDSIREDPRFRRIVVDRRLPVAGLCRIPAGEGKS